MTQEQLLNGDEATTPKALFEEWGSRSLAGDFVVVPFNVLSAQRGEWQARKRAWVAWLGLNRAITDLGRASNLGRKANVARSPQFYRQKAEHMRMTGEAISTPEFEKIYKPSGNARVEHSVSQFDPVLCEVVTTWYSKAGDLIVDPFAGDVERGLVAAALGRRYIGIEIRQEQCAANTGIAEELGFDIKPRWVNGDARRIAELLKDEPPADLVFTCPPYWNLEVYSDHVDDLSNMSLHQFMMGMSQSIESSLACLADNRFAVMVMGDQRHGPMNSLVNLPARMVNEFEVHGAALHVDAIFQTALGSKPQLARYSFERRRTLTPTYEHVLIACKGDPGLATQALGQVAPSEHTEFLATGGQLRMEGME